MNKEQLNDKTHDLRAYIEQEKFKGYDPYDTLNSFIPFTLFGTFTAAVAIQLQKRNPINIRPLLGIKKEYNPKGIGLLLEAYCTLYEKDPKPEYKTNIDFLFNWLIKNYTKGYSGMCWGYNFGWANPIKYLPPFSPTVVVSGFVSRAIYKYCLLFENDEANKALQSIAEFVVNDIPTTKTEDGICFSYSTKMKECCYNASLLAAEILLYSNSLKGNSNYLKKATSAVNFVLSKQHNDGHWNYSIDIETGKERKQIDFHQGYVIDSIQNFIHLTNPKDDKYKLAVKKGMEYYRTQFYENGRSKWRIPKEHPTDIHNQSQGVVTFTKLSNLDSSYLPFAETIAKWTIDNMQSPKGYFYYRKYPSHTNKIPYMRWSNAWMFLALAKLSAAE